ncbi:hypothetical protein HUK80_09240 [Flavobacterium sp. MAH-1]|uniref:Uncharacterized protein n=1 Tax=Flavobacterium agri TaxID=2743471 RepID=A0A7Y9C5A4_9FLAO|nr:hypothetical protein [Flavobacterium agri]NUY81077.1 hypothetical protein [Flavobacterium agri]NYA71101.1 hypothetical protein [Flavobacterium agri]
MKRFSLELLYHIVGIGSASGLFYADGSVFIASDNAGYLYEFRTKDQTLSKIKLFDSQTLENIPKKHKPDFEAVAQKDGKLYLFGSGSTDKRNAVSVVDVKTKEITNQDLSDLYAEMRHVSKIDADNFNLEGAFATDDAWFFFQRGNGSGGNNGIFKIIGSLGKFSKVNYLPMELPKIKHVTTSFTDAILIDDTIWFLATAEDTNSTYEDGEVLGSLIGKIDFETMQVVFSEQITDKQKFEGLALYSKSDNEISFFLCEDNDTDGMESGIFLLKMSY